MRTVRGSTVSTLNKTSTLIRVIFTYFCETPIATTLKTTFESKIRIGTSLTCPFKLRSERSVQFNSFACFSTPMETPGSKTPPTVCRRGETLFSPLQPLFVRSDHLNRALHGGVLTYYAAKTDSGLLPLSLKVGLPIERTSFLPNPIQRCCSH